MKKSILFTSLAVAVLSSALVSAEETSVESLASSTDATVVTEEASTTASSETLSDILATGTPATSVTEMSETTAPSDTASAVTELSSTESSEQSSTDKGVVKLDFAKNYVSGGEKSSIANDVVVVMQGGVLPGMVTGLTRNEDGTYKVTLSSGQSLTVSADKIGAEVLAKLEKTKTEPSSTEAEPTLSSAEVSSTVAATAGHQQPSATINADSTTSSPKATETSKVETRKENKQSMPATGDKSGLVASLVGAGLLAVTAILRKRKIN